MLIAGKPLKEFAAEEFHAHVTAMYSETSHRKQKARTPSQTSGLTFIRTKKGALSVRRTKSVRAFAFVLRDELPGLAAQAGTTQAEVWNCLRAAKFIVADTRMQAEIAYAQIKEIPW